MDFCWHCSYVQWRIAEKWWKTKNTYVILRELHNWEKHPSVINTLEMVIQILIGDEPETGKFLFMCVTSWHNYLVVAIYIVNSLSRSLQR